MSQPYSMLLSVFSDDLLVTSGNALKDQGSPLIDKKMGQMNGEKMMGIE